MQSDSLGKAMRCLKIADSAPTVSSLSLVVLLVVVLVVVLP